MIETFLRTQDNVWPETLGELAGEIHPVDRAATRIWFSFFPLGFHEIVEREGGTRDFGAVYQARGVYRLKEMVDTSHWFLYGHAFWPDVKRVILEASLAAVAGAPASVEGIDAVEWVARGEAQPGEGEWVDAAASAGEGGRLVAFVMHLARRTGHPVDLVAGLTAIGLMTLRQCGRAAFGGELAKTNPPAKSPGQVLAERATGKKAWLGARQPRVTFRENEPSAWFPIAAGQEITTAAERDKRPHHLADDRCFENMGPIPVECRSGKCGTCWVGVLGGNERLAPMGVWERQRLNYFGYFDSGFERLDDERPLIRLACQAQAEGSVSIVIPPWCGVPARGRPVRLSEGL